MPFRSRIHPIRVNGVTEAAPVMKQTPRSRMKRLFERPFSLKNLSGVDSSRNSEEYDPSSFFLRRMVERYIEDPDEKQPKCNYFNCFSGSGTDSSSDEDEEESSPGGVLRTLKNLLLCTNFYESGLETKANEIVETDNVGKAEKSAQLRKLADELVALGYDAAICTALKEKSKSKWSSVPAGDYEYLDVLIGGNRVLIELDFPSKFEIARPTETYKTILQTLPYVFVGQADRLKKIVVFVSKAANKSYKKSGLSMPPWRKDKFLFTKWATHYDRAKRTPAKKNHLRRWCYGTN